MRSGAFFCFVHQTVFMASWGRRGAAKEETLQMRWKLVTAIYVVVFAALSGTIGATLKVHELQAADRATHAKEAVKLEQATATLRFQALALEETTVERDAAQQQVSAVSSQRDQLQARADDLQAQVNDLKTRVAYSAAVVGLGGGGGPSAAAPASFPYGYCTWYVASRRQVTWSGNAINWWANASGIRPEGQMPQVGAIMVSRESWWGHVAYVESVTSASVFTVAEMNYLGWGLVDRRVVNRALVPVLGFIY